MTIRVLVLFHAVLWISLQCMIVVIPDHSDCDEEVQDLSGFPD